MIELAPSILSADFTRLGAEAEAVVDLDRTLHLIAAHRCKPGVVINPATPVHALDEVLPLVHHVLVMSVNPGFGGQTFIHSSLKKIELLSKIRESRRLGFRIEVDGGVHHDTVADVVRAGAEILVTGSAIFKQGNPSENARQLLKSALDAAKQPVQDLSSPMAGGAAGDCGNSLSLP